MLEDYTIVIPLIHDWDWTADFQRQTGLTLAKNKNTIVALELHKKFIKFRRLIFSRENPVKKRGKNLYLVTPFHPLPFERFEKIFEANEKLSYILLIIWMRIKFRSRKKMILWLFYPKHYWLLAYFKKYAKGKFITVFDCVDYFSATSDKAKREMRNQEKKLIVSSDIVVANSKVLLEHCKKVRKDVYLVPQGFLLDDFESHPKPSKKISKKKPVIGYVGGINNRLDYGLIISLARNNPGWNFIIWGPRQKDSIDKNSGINKKIKTLLSLPNVTHGVFKNKKDIPGLIAQFDIGIVPYTKADFNTYCYPMKLFEYFYKGKPVVSTPIKELERFPKFVKIGKTTKDWERHIKFLLSKPWPETYKKEQKKLAEQNSWEEKIEAISNLL